MANDSLLQPQSPDVLLIVAGAVPMVLVIVALRFLFVRSKSLGESVDVAMLQRGAMISRGEPAALVAPADRQRLESSDKRESPSMLAGSSAPAGKRLTIPVDRSDNFSRQDRTVATAMEKADEDNRLNLWIQPSSIGRAGDTTDSATAYEGQHHFQLPSSGRGRPVEAQQAKATPRSRDSELDSALLSTPLRPLLPSQSSGAGVVPRRGSEYPAEPPLKPNPLGPLFAGVGCAPQTPTSMNY
jgi:hypothetical protein